MRVVQVLILVILPSPALVSKLSCYLGKKVIPVNNNGRLLLLVETPSNSQVGTSRAATVCIDSKQGTIINKSFEVKKSVNLFGMIVLTNQVKLSSWIVNY